MSTLDTIVTDPPENVERTTYPQNWPVYNAAQCEEKDRFKPLLAELCSTIEQPEQVRGRPRLPLGDMVFAATYKVFSGFSSRRFTSDLREAHADGLVSQAPHFNSVSNYLRDESLTPILKEMIRQSSLPLAAIETDFAVDATGFATSRYERWYMKRYGKQTDRREWVKLHAICGVRTLIITSAEVSDWRKHDSPFFVPLLEDTAERFDVWDVSADKAYLSRQNVATAAQLGAEPLIPFKSNSVRPTGKTAWSRMYHQFALEAPEFMARYHKRSNVESAFSAMKRKYGDGLRSKDPVALTNETLAKVLCHNISIVARAAREFGIEPEFANTHTVPSSA